MTAAQRHVVSISIGGKEIRGWTEYQIDVGMLEPADAFSLTIPASREVWDLIQPDRPARILIDGVPRITGFVDQPTFAASSGAFTVRGRCKGGRLVQESAPTVNYEGLTLVQLVLRLASPWFDKVVLSNARNRRVMRGKGKKVASSDRVFVDSRVGRRIDPGQMRWQVIEELCAQAGYICWASADGRELVIGQPDYTQEIQHTFFHPKAGSRRLREGNCEEIEIKPSTADRYSRIVVLGAGAGSTASYGFAAAARAGEAKNNPATTDGEGKDFTQPKRLVIADRDVKNRKTAVELARREMARRDMSAAPISLKAFGHGQVVGGRQPTLYTPDTLARVEDEVTGTRGVYLIASCSYRSSRREAETTVLELLPKGTELAA